MKLSSINQRRLNLLDETVQHYSEDTKRRNTQLNNSCKYSPKTTNKEGISAGCAIGRKLSPELAEKIDKAFPSGVSITQLLSGTEYVKEMPKELTSMGVVFLQKLQQLHDGRSFWHTNGLNSDGQEFYQQIYKGIQKDKFTSDLVIKM